MSWFSTAFRPSEDQRSGNNSDEEDEGTHGKGVKEDLSELTKTFSRQLWGVAAFLAPPPPAPTTHRNSFSDDGVDEAPNADLHFDSIDEAPSRHLMQVRPSMARPSIDDTEDSTPAYHHSHAKPTGDRLSTDEGSVIGTIEPPLHRSLIEHGKQYHLTGKREPSEELVDIDFKTLMEENQKGPLEAVKGQDLNSVQDPKGSSHTLHHRSVDLLGQNAADSLTGISRDLAELKGSVATGFSKILKAVKEEVGQEEAFNSMKYNHDEKEEIDDDLAASHGRKLPGMNMLFGPLLSNIFLDDGAKNRSNASSGDDEEEVYEHRRREDYDGQVSPQARAFKLFDGLKGISEFASSLIAGGKEEAWERETNSQVVGITEDVLAFATNISMHPENWLDSPLFAYATKDDDLEMSHTQKAHIHALELAIPRLSVLRTELCPDCMSESSFWKIYFVLLHSRLSREDAVILSTPKVMEARLHLLQILEDRQGQKVRTQRRELRTSKGKEALAIASSSRAVSVQSAMEVHANDFGHLEDVETNPAEEIQNKSVLLNTMKLATSNYKGKATDRDQWLHEEPLGLRNEEDVSFSDLEEEDEPTVKSVERSSSTQSLGWVQLSKNQSVENFEGLGAFEIPEQQGSRHGDGGAGGETVDVSLAQTSRKQYQSESSDWSTVEEDDAANSDYA